MLEGSMTSVHPLYSYCIHITYLLYADNTDVTSWSVFDALSVFSSKFASFLKSSSVPYAQNKNKFEYEIKYCTYSTSQKKRLN